MKAGKKRKKVPVRPVVSLRVRPAMYEDLTREAERRRLKLSEEIERRLIWYEDHFLAERVEAWRTKYGAGARFL